MIDWTKKITPNDKLIAARESRRNQLKGERDTKLAEPINNVQVATPVDRENISGTIDMWVALGSPLSIPWTMADNTVANMSKDDLEAIKVAYAQRKALVFGQYQALCEQVELSSDPDNIVWLKE